MNHTIFAWTGPTPPEGYPAFVNISRDEQGNHTVAVRSQGNGGRDTAVAEIPVEALESLLCDLASDLYRDDTSGVPAAETQQEISMNDQLRTALDLTLTKEEAEGLAAFIDAELESDDDVVRLLIGDGHSGYGLYASCPEYPEEGAILVKNLPAPPGVPAGVRAAPPSVASSNTERVVFKCDNSGGCRFPKQPCLASCSLTVNLAPASGVAGTRRPLTTDEAEGLFLGSLGMEGRKP